MSGLARLGIAKNGVASVGISRNGVAGVSGAFNPLQLFPLQYLYLEENPEVIDKTENALDADYVDANCTTWFAGGDYMSVSDLVGTETVVSSEGTSTPSISAGRIDFTAGTCWNLVLDSGHHFLLMEGTETDFYNIGTGSNGIAQSVTESLLWGTRQSDNAANVERGFSKVISFNGVDAYVEINNSAGLFNFGTNDFTMSGTCFNPTDTAEKYLIGKYDYSANKRQWAIRFVVGNIVLRTSPDGISYVDNTVDSSNIPSGWFSFEVTKSGTSASWKINDLAVPSSGSCVATIYDSDSTVLIGAAGNGSRASYYSGAIQSLRIGDTQYLSRDAYDTTLTDSNGTNGATLVNVGLKAIPANSAGTDDVLGLGLTNPPCGEDRIWNNFEGYIQQKAANTEFLDNPFWSADGTNYDKKGTDDFLAHLNFDNNVVINRTNSWSVKEILTWAISKNWTPSEYIRMINWLASQGSVQENLIPAKVTAGTGIGPDFDWADNGSGGIVFVSP